MAECHPVGFQWVMEAKARGAKVIHIDPRFTRTSAVADLHVPLRVGHRHRVPRRPDQVRPGQRPVLQGVRRRLHERGGAGARGLPGHRGPRRPVLRLRPGEAALRRGSLAVRGREARRRHTGDEPAQPAREAAAQEQQVGEHGPTSSAPTRRRPPAAAGPPMRGQAASATRRCSTRAASSRCSSGTSPATRRRWWPRSAASSRRCSRRSPSGSRRTAAATGRRRGSTRSAGRSTRVGAQYIRTASILQTLLGNIGRPGGGIMALRGHASIQGSTDIPTLFNLLPGYLPMPHADAARVARRLRAPTRRHTAGFWGNMRAYMVSLLKAWWGDAATAGERLLLRLPAAGSTATTAPTARSPT